jgi:hypothetical protein
MALGGCRPEDHPGYRPDWRAPAVPRGFTSQTGDHRVDLFWIANSEDDLAGYRIYRSTSPRGYFPRVAAVGPDAVSYVDEDVDNGVTYYYVMSACDRAGNESDLVPDPIQDTPRPEGFSLRLENAALNPMESGYDFSERRVLDSSDLNADIYFWQTPDGGSWMIGTERSAEVYTDLQDAGFVRLEQIDRAPESGWSPTGEVALITGHSYVVWTWDDHYAKFRVVDLNPERVIVDWAYQTDRDNRELLVSGHHPTGSQGTPRVHQHGMERRIQS